MLVQDLPNAKSILLEEPGGDIVFEFDKEKLMINALHWICDTIKAFGSAMGERTLVFLENAKLQAEGDTFSFPQNVWYDTSCEVLGPRSTPYEVIDDKRLWRRRLAFVGLDNSSNKGLVGNKKVPVTDFTAQAADYAQLHMSGRPFQLFSIGLLISGKMFCVAIFDQEGVEFSKLENMWENLDLFVRVARRLFAT